MKIFNELMKCFTPVFGGAVNDGYGIKSLIHEEYIEYCIDAKSNSTNHTIWEAYIDGHMRAWYHAAEIPKEEQLFLNHVAELIRQSY